MTLNTQLIGTPRPALKHSYDWRDCVHYALSVGAKTPAELRFIYEHHGPDVLPTFAVVPSLPALSEVCEKLGADRKNILHGEQTVTLHRPIAAHGTITTQATVTGMYDKGTGALVVVHASSRDEHNALVFDTVFSIFVRGAGGFGGDRGPGSSSQAPPNRAPDFAWTESTSPEQAAHYRLCGDLNPLHICPDHARAAGFTAPILHGLCTYGHAGRAVLWSCCEGEPSRFKSLHARFSGVVFPGDTLTTRGWQVTDTQYAVTVCKQDGTVVLSHGVATID